MFFYLGNYYYYYYYYCYIILFNIAICILYFITHLCYGPWGRSWPEFIIVVIIISIIIKIIIECCCCYFFDEIFIVTAILVQPKDWRVTGGSRSWDYNNNNNNYNKINDINKKKKHYKQQQQKQQQPANLTQSRIGASLVWHIRQMSPFSTWCSISTC
jgi:hypothetical protein